jgi:hypothetical protein
MSLLIQLPRALAHKAADQQDGPHAPADLEAVAARCEPLVLAGRATHVPQAAVTSGMQRTVTVTWRRLFGWAHGSDLARLGTAKLHGMQGVKARIGPCRAPPADRSRQIEDGRTASPELVEAGHCFEWFIRNPIRWIRVGMA